ncbi:hypothetical protein BROUX41_003593 [Berkeleyomyces rouxiae]|uniref:uncharacterized protein n=1 Tax=Berkeleyomyces rouxiae TaxID=2035830 RepID=UPI003B7DF252
MSCDPAYWDDLGSEELSSTSRSRDVYARGTGPRPAAPFGQSFAPHSYMTQHCQNTQPAARIDRRHSHAIGSYQPARHGHDHTASEKDERDPKTMRRPKAQRRRRSEYDEDAHFSQESQSDDSAEDDEDYDCDSNSDSASAYGGRRHTTGGRHGRSSRSQELTADDLNATYDPHRSNPIAIAPPPRRESYLEEQALSARGDRLGGYFPLHEDPSLRIQRSHPFHSASAKARKQSITLAQSAAAQHSAALASRRPSVSSRLDPGSSLSASISHTRPDSYASTPSQRHDYLSSSTRHADPVAGSSHSSTNPAIPWRTIHGFNTSKASRKPGISSMASVSGLDKLTGRMATSSHRNYDEVDPLDHASEPRPRTQPPMANHRPPPPLSPSRESPEQHYEEAFSSPPIPVSMGKYYPSVYEKSQQSRRQYAESRGMNPDEVSYYSSDEHDDDQSLPPGDPMNPSSERQYRHSRSASKSQSQQSYDRHAHHQRTGSSVAYQDRGYHTPSRSMGPESPRLNPLGSPGPVTPMDLEAHALAAGGPNSYFDRSLGGVVNPKLPRDPRTRG